MSNEFLSPHYWPISKLFTYRFCVPVYQRPYSWSVNEMGVLLKDIYTSFLDYQNTDDNNKQKVSYYTGNIIIHQRDFEIYDIIDGQQRITSFAIILLAIYSLLSALNCDKNDTIYKKLQSALWKTNIEENPKQNERVVELGSIDKDLLISMFNEAYSNPSKMEGFVKNYNTKTPYERNIIENFCKVYRFVNEEFEKSSDKLRSVKIFANYILTRVFLISIICEESEIKAFSVFESINSKGKRLDDIDLIKTRIFSVLGESDYQSYLSKWGDLIIRTEDKLGEYFKIYIKAQIRYFSGNLTFEKFKSYDREICEHFGCDNICDAYKVLIEDMLEKLDSFNALFDYQVAQKFIKSNSKFKYYYGIYYEKYEHCRPLFFKAFCEYSDEKLSTEDLVNIFVETIKFCVSYMTIMSRDSKDVISMFSEIFSQNRIDRDFVVYKIRNKMSIDGIRKEDVLSKLMNMDLYNDKRLGAFVISSYESRISSNASMPISWDEASAKFSSYGSHYELDHIMVQTPENNDVNLKYYKLGNNLKLKPGNDFPLDIVHDGMDYDDFKKLILHRAGNLRLKGGDGNSSKGNESEIEICTYSKMQERNKNICEFFVDNVLNFIEVSKGFDINQIGQHKKKKIVGTFDLSMDFDFTGSKPKKISICGNDYQVKDSKDILTTIVTVLYENYEDRLLTLASEGWSPKRRKIISQSPEGMKSPFTLLDGKIYIETNLSAYDIKTYSIMLLDDFGVEKELVSIYFPDK